MSSLEKKYQVKPGNYYDGVRKDILYLVPKFSKRVLEIGCGNADTLSYLKINGYCEWTCGVDLFPEAIESAKGKVDELYQGSIEEMRLPIENSSIDMILCLDVLEHLVNPDKVIAYLHTLLNQNGVIIASIPNVRHLSVVLPLVFQNKWEYKNGGVLDNTHLKFFVKDTAIQMMTSSGLKVVDVGFNLGGVGGKINLFTFGLIKSFCILQYLIKVSR